MSNSTALIQHKTPVAALAALCNFADAQQFAVVVRSTVFPNGQATNEQLLAFCAVAHMYGLNPFLKQIYAFPSKGGGIVPMVSVDGWATIVAGQEKMDGMEFEDHWDDKGELVAVTCTIRRKDWASPCKITEYMAECQGNSGPWQKSPNRMLRHRAMIQCARLAFGLGGVHDEAEGNAIIDAEIGAAPEKPKTLAGMMQPKQKPNPEQDARIVETTTVQNPLTEAELKELDRQDQEREDAEVEKELFAAKTQPKRAPKEAH